LLSGTRGIIVTGGTGALGRALVLGLLDQGHRVAVPYRRDNEWSALQAAAGAAPATLWGRQADIARPQAAQAFVDEAVGWMDRLDGVACLAGAWAGAGRLESAPTSEWDDMLVANLSPVYSMCRAGLPRLLVQGGSVVTVGSRMAETGGAGAAGYAVAKQAVHALTRVLALENRDRGVRFNCVLPGTIDTPANRASMPRADFSRWTSPAAIARVISFLLSPDSAPITGALIPVDGQA
jgi:NAD(P)-dependent dehydrogenase (short-subunit alcohol dehydrogenase family)